MQSTFDAGAAGEETTEFSYLGLSARAMGIDME